MNQLPCITTAMPGRPCIIRGEHLEACLWAQIEDAAKVEGVTTGMIMQAREQVGLSVPPKPCRGCVPRPAEHGLLCDTCWPKFEQALAIAEDLITHLRSIDRPAQSVDGVRTAQGSKVIVPGSWLAADELWSDLVQMVIAHAGDPEHEPDWPVASAQRVEVGIRTTATLDEVAAGVRRLVAWIGDPETFSARTAGAEAAVVFFRHVQTQLHRFPMDDTAAPMPMLRCRHCKMFAVRQHPPLHYLAERVLKCDVCDHEADPLLVDWDLKLYAQEVWEALTPEERARLLPDLDTDEKRVVRQLGRTDVETMRAKVWDRLGDEIGRVGPARVAWFNTARPQWGGLTADQMIEAGRGEEVLNLIGAAA